MPRLHNQLTIHFNHQVVYQMLLRHISRLHSRLVCQQALVNHRLLVCLNRHLVLHTHLNPHLVNRINTLRQGRMALQVRTAPRMDSTVRMYPIAHLNHQLVLLTPCPLKPRLLAIGREAGTALDRAVKISARSTATRPKQMALVHPALLNLVAIAFPPLQTFPSGPPSAWRI